MLKFSVLIAVYNKERFIAETLESVMAQRFRDFELLILNDGSTDKSEEQIQPFLKDRRVRYFSQANAGISAARNFLIKEATAPLLAFLDADDYWYPGYLEEQDRLTKYHPNHHVFTTASEFIKDEKIHPKHYSIPSDISEEIKLNFFEASYLDCILHSSTLVVTPEVFEQVGFYNTSLKTGEDTDFYIRLGLQYEVIFSPRTLVRYRVDEHSLSRTEISFEGKATFQAYEAYEKDHPALKKYLDLNRYSLCMLAKTQGDKEQFQQLYDKINLENLSNKQRFLLSRPAFVYRSAKGIQDILLKMGVRLSSFKG